MAIQANISSTQYGTTHDKAYIKVSKLYANYIKNTTHVELCVYNSAEDYLNNKTALYNQDVSYSQEQTDILWNNEEPINSLNEVYRMVNLELEEDIKYEGLKNLLDIEVVEKGGLSEEEQQELANLTIKSVNQQNLMDRLSKEMQEVYNQTKDPTTDPEYQSLQMQYADAKAQYYVYINRIDELSKKENEEGERPKTEESSLKDEPTKKEYVSEENGEYKVDEEKMEEKMNTKE